MPDRRSRSRRGPRAAGAEPPPLPDGPVAIDTGWVELVRDRSTPGAVTVMVNGVPSSHVELDDPTWLEFEYMQQMATVVDALPAGPLDAVHLGAGACSLPRWLDARRPGSRQIAVDVDAALLTLVRTWFDLPRSPRLRLRPGDARTRLTELPDSSADLVVRDVFAGDRTPADLGTREFVEEVARVLRPGGVYLANCADRPPLGLARSEMATIRSVLPGSALISEPGMLRGRRYGNLVLVGTRPGAGGLDLADAGLARTLRSLPVPTRLLRGPELDAFVRSALPLADPPRRAPSEEGPEPAC